MATIAAICVAYGSPALFAMLHGPDSQADRANGHHQASNTDFPPFDVAGKFRHHDMLRSGFPALQDCIEQQERLCSEWMPEVSAALVKCSPPKLSLIYLWLTMQHRRTTAYLRLPTALSGTSPCLPRRHLPLRCSCASGMQCSWKDASCWSLSPLPSYMAFEVRLRFDRSCDGQADADECRYAGVILSPKADFETILNALGGAFVVENPDAFMEWVRKKMSAWRKAADAA